MDKLQDAKIVLADLNMAWHPSKLLQLEWLQLTAAGVDQVIEKISQQPAGSYAVTRFGGVFGPHLAQYVIGHIISWERGFQKMWGDQQRHKWDAIWRRQYKYRLMSELSIGILGLGDIGRVVAEACKSLGMTVWGVGRQEKAQNRSCVDQYRTMSNLPEVLQSCDFVCNILPSTPATKNLLSGNVLESGKDNSPVFINVGRGDIIDEKSLVCALDQGWISGAILDVFEAEPLPKESALWEIPQVVITPHIASVSFPEQLADFFSENVSLYERGEQLKFLVDLERGY